MKKVMMAVALAGLLVSGGALAFAAASDEDAPAGHSGLDAASEVQAVAPDALADLGRAARDGRVPVPDRDGALAIAEGRGRTTRIDHPSGVSVVVMRAGETMCVVEDAGAMACGPAPERIVPGRPPINVTLVGEDRYRVTAVLPDGATSVRVEHGNGAVTTLDVVDNVASAEVSGTPRRFRYTDHSGREHAQALSGRIGG